MSICKFTATGDDGKKYTVELVHSSSGMIPVLDDGGELILLPDDEHKLKIASTGVLIEIDD